MCSTNPPVNGVSVLPGKGDIWSASLTAWTFQCTFASNDVEDSSGKHMGSKVFLNKIFVVICCHLLSCHLQSVCRIGGLIPTCIQDSAFAMAGECSTPRLWRVCGGQGKSGILVRHGAGRGWKSRSGQDKQSSTEKEHQSSTNVKYIKIRRNNGKQSSTQDE